MTEPIIPSEPFITDGISLGIPNQSATDITSLDNAISADSDGNLIFKDNYTKTLTDINGNPLNYIKLKDLFQRIQGVYSVDGVLYFKDSTVPRPYSLKEIIDAYVQWKSKLTTGGIYWIGSTKITNNDCNNIIVDVNGDPTVVENTVDGRIFVKLTETNDYPGNAVGTKVFSLDRYLSQLSDYDSNITPNGYAYNADGSMRWHDVPNLSIILPPLDVNKACFILAKVNARLVSSNLPILFRLFDKTANVELDRKSINNSSALSSEQQPILTFVGALPEFTTANKISCNCDNTSDQIELQNDPPHTITIQFHTDDILTSDVSYSCVDGNTNGIHYKSLERRLLGFPNSISNVPITNMSIDTIIFDINKNDSIGRKSGNVSFKNQNYVNIAFANPFTGSDYIINLSCNKNINTWYTNKKSTGFTIVAENNFTGTIDWIATKIKSQGDA